jgi:hypothetical protein
MSNYALFSFLARSQPIQSHSLWQCNRNIDESPEAKLIYAVFSQAWLDGSKLFPSTKRESARNWFFSETFYYFCDLIDVSPTLIQETLT